MFTNYSIIGNIFINRIKGPIVLYIYQDRMKVQDKLHRK